jgi:hypothetical protein
LLSGYYADWAKNVSAGGEIHVRAGEGGPLRERIKSVLPRRVLRAVDSVYPNG